MNSPIKDITFVRLTKSEYEQVQAKKVGEKFIHINLQHYGVPKELLTTSKCLAILIKKHGDNKNGLKKEPVLEYENTIPLEQTAISYSILIKDIIKIGYFIGKPPLILHNKNSILESLFNRYGKLMGITKEELLEMKCYIREFRRKQNKAKNL